jgi:hypothetical protein
MTLEGRSDARGNARARTRPSPAAIGRRSDSRHFSRMNRSRPPSTSRPDARSFGPSSTTLSSRIVTAPIDRVDVGRCSLSASRSAPGLLSVGQLLSSVDMRRTPPPSSGEDPETEEAFAAHGGLVPPPRVADAEHPQRASGTAMPREWTTLPTVAVTPVENRTLTTCCALASAVVGPPSVDSAEVLRALVRVMGVSEELRYRVRDELARSRRGPTQGLWPADGAGPASIELAVEGASAPRRAPVVMLSRRGRHRAPPGR